MIPVIPDSDELQKTGQALQDEVEQLRQQLIEYEATSQSQVRQLDALSAALQESEQRYDSLFSQLPRGLQEEDYSSIKKAIDKLQAEGAHDLKKYLLNNKDFLKELVRTIEITNVNQAILDIHQEDSLEKWLEKEDAIDDWWDEQWADYYASEFTAFAGHEGSYEDQLRY